MSVNLRIMLQVKPFARHPVISAVSKEGRLTKEQGHSCPVGRPRWDGDEERSAGQECPCSLGALKGGRGKLSRLASRLIGADSRVM